MVNPYSIPSVSTYQNRRAANVSALPFKNKKKTKITTSSGEKITLPAE
jgi:hypothetical protein